MSTSLPRLGEGADFIGAGDDVVIISGDGRSFDHLNGTLVDVIDDTATVNVGCGVWISVPFDRIAHADSPQAEAIAIFGQTS
jgi:preprotein translocase subunit YajC